MSLSLEPIKLKLKYRCFCLVRSHLRWAFFISFCSFLCETSAMHTLSKLLHMNIPIPILCIISKDVWWKQVEVLHITRKLHVAKFYMTKTRRADPKNMSIIYSYWHARLRDKFPEHLTTRKNVWRSTNTASFIWR